jgi:hypothetical protein
MPSKASNSPEFRPFASKWRLMTRLLGLPLILRIGWAGHALDLVHLQQEVLESGRFGR